MKVRQQNGGSTVTSYTTLFLVKDHLGSVRAVTDSYGHVLERNSYYPFGLQTNQGESYPTINTSLNALYPNRVSATQAKRVLYNGKEIQNVAGTDYLDYGFRQYDPVTARWMAVDPKVEKYTALTPYNFCAGNPMIIIDLLGKDIWEINKIGKIVKHIKDKSQDTFYLVDDKGNRTIEKSSIEGNKSSSITFEYGTIKFIYKKYEKEEAETCYSISNEASGAELFKFFADNTKIEYGLINTQEGNSFLITNHQESKVSATQTAIFLNIMGYTITSVIHNHPNNSIPSGFNSSSGDRYSAGKLVESHGFNVDYFIYLPKSTNLIQYDYKMYTNEFPWNLIFQERNQ